MTHEELVQLLHDAGFDSGWSLAGKILVIWQHDTDPPAPLVRPTEATDEATTADADTGADPE
jgi:hypothetical protein